MNNPLFVMQNKNQFFQRLQQLKATGGDPEQRIREMLNSGRITQADYNRAVERAQELKRMFGI
jgi:hypothetical protein